MTRSLDRKMAALESCLGCPICGELMNNPFTLNCGHGYCSLCIRRHLDKTLNFTTSDICPTCREKAFTEHLRPSQTLAVAIENFIVVKKESLGRSEIDTSNNGHLLRQTDENEECNDARMIEGQTSLRKMAHAHFHGLPKDKAKGTISLFS